MTACIYFIFGTIIEIGPKISQSYFLYLIDKREFGRAILSGGRSCLISSVSNRLIA